MLAGGGVLSDSNSSTGGCDFFCMDLVPVNLPLITHLTFKILINIWRVRKSFLEIQKCKEADH